MSWWGKVLGGIFGYLLDGPVTALLGALLGHAVDSLGSGSTRQSKVDRKRRNSQHAARALYFTSTFSVMGHVCKADGHVTKDEIRVASDIMQRMELSNSQREKAIKLFNEGKTPDFPLDSVLGKLRNACITQKNLLLMFMEIQLTAAFADGELSHKEHKLLQMIADRLGIRRMEYQKIEERVRISMQSYSDTEIGDRTFSESTVRDAYSLLGVENSASDREVKSAYRRLLSQHHPDKLVSKGLPEEMMKMATQKTHEIRQAYEIICTARGI